MIPYYNYKYLFQFVKAEKIQKLNRDSKGSKEGVYRLRMSYNLNFGITF